MTGERSEEFRGKSLDAAINAGLAALRVTREQVQIEVIRPGSRGVLGIGAEDAIVRLTVAPPSRPEPKAETSAPPATPSAEPKPAPRQRTSRAPRPAPAATVATDVATPAAEPRPRPVVNGDKDLAAAEQGSVVLTGLLERMGLQARVEIGQQSEAETDESGESVYVLNIIGGDDLGTLIGRQNEVLSALELVTRLMVNQQGHSHSGFVVDVNGYRAKRAEALRKLALRMAEQAVQSGRTMVLEPMPPAERRIIHIALREHPDVTTQSVGEGDHRKFTIVPKKA
jgi:spoIIIJ-associated protein